MIESRNAADCVNISRQSHRWEIQRHFSRATRFKNRSLLFVKLYKFEGTICVDVLVGTLPNWFIFVFKCPSRNKYFRKIKILQFRQNGEIANASNTHSEILTIIILHPSLA